MSAMIASSIASFCLVFTSRPALYLGNRLGKNDLLLREAVVLQQSTLSCAGYAAGRSAGR